MELFEEDEKQETNTIGSLKEIADGFVRKFFQNLAEAFSDDEGGDEIE